MWPFTRNYFLSCFPELLKDGGDSGGQEGGDGDISSFRYFQLISNQQSRVFTKILLNFPVGEKEEDIQEKNSGNWHSRNIK